MIYIELPEVQPEAFPHDQHQLGDGDGSRPDIQSDDLSPRITRGDQYE
jgi:hypothetical protein